MRGFSFYPILAGGVALLLAGLAPLGAQFSGGSGTPEDPFLVATAEDLNAMRNHLSLHFRQTADIDLGVAPWNSGSGWAPVGTQSAPFKGSFDGNGYLIRNLRIRRGGQEFIGLFGILDPGATLRNVGLVNASVRGGLGVGGLVGFSWGEVEDSFVRGEVTGDGNWVGGLVGDSRNRIARCYFSGTVSGVAFVGGIAGQTSDGSVVSLCYARGSITGQATSAGGLVGDASGQVDECYFEGMMAGDASVGGLVGTTRSTSAVSRSYARADVSAKDGFAGGLVGSNGGTVSRSYAAGTVVSEVSEVGGLVGEAFGAGTVEFSYWDTETSEVEVSAGGTGEPTALLKQSATYESWNFLDTWGIVAGETYPFLRNMRYRVHVFADPVEGGVVSGGTTRSHGESITVGAESAEGFEFRHWREGTTVVSEQKEYTFTVTRDLFLGARMARETYTLLYRAGIGGSLTGNTEQSVSFGSDGSAVTAQPEPGAEFHRWSDGVITRTRTDLGIEDDVEVTAHFRTNPQTGGRQVWLPWYEQWDLAPRPGGYWSELDHLDSDGNGVPNWMEFYADTNPLDPRSRLRITRFELGPPLVIRFGPVSTERNYLLYYNTSLSEEGWVQVPEEQISSFAIVGDEGRFTLPVNLIQAEGSNLKRYYRVRVLLP